MIKIKKLYSTKETDRYYKFLLSRKIKSKYDSIQSLGNEIVKIIKKIIKKTNHIKINDFKDLIMMDFKEMKDIVNSIDSNVKVYDKLYRDHENILQEYKELYKKVFTLPDSTINNKKNNISLIQDLGVTVCPYCNRNYINSRDKNLGCEFDHYYSKSRYPFFALTLSNLIPSCSTCNRIKNKKKYQFCPFDLECIKKVEFKVSPPSSHSKIQLFFDDSRESGNPLKLEAAYNINQRDVDEMFRREQEYCKDYREYLINLLGKEGKKEKNITESFFDIMIFGEIAKDNFDDYLNVPLSKLKKDTYDYIVQLREED